MGLIWFLGTKKSQNPGLKITAQVDVVISWKAVFNSLQYCKIVRF